MAIWKWSHAGLFVGGMLFATKGVEILASKKAHDAYVQAAAFGLRARDEIMNNVTAVREECEDVYAEAILLNEQKASVPAADPEVIEDKSRKSQSAASKKTAVGKSSGKKSK